MTLCTKTVFCQAGAELPLAGLREVAEGAKSGKLVVFPTDTVYGIGTSALIPESRERIYALKERDPRKALPILVHSADDARRWAEFTPKAVRLAEKYWPGPLTLVLAATEEGRRIASPGTDTIALRVPASEVLRRTIAMSEVPWATTSANQSGEPACVDGTEAAEAFSGRVEFIVDAGPGGGEASTVVDASGESLKILREGALSASEILG
jgi:L-threonylcarbamoyladenylate synthase